MTVLQTAAAVAGGLATAAYLDAKFLIRNDLRTGSATRNVSKAGEYVAQEFSQGRGLLYHYFEAHALGKNANNIFLIFEGREWTYKQFYDEVQLVGNWLLDDLKIQKGEIIALDGLNSPQYVMFIIAINGIGAGVSYINNNLTSTPLVHCAKLCRARYLLADTAVQHLVSPCESDLTAANIRTVYYDFDLTSTIPQKTTPLSPSLRQNISPTAIARLIYTSGTTGLPKAVKLPYARELVGIKSVSEYLRLRPGVRMYTCLPLYHVSGHTLCTIPSIYAGSTVSLSPKFSHKTFWPEIRASGAQIVQHVGELIRYVLNAPPSDQDRNHNVQMVWGNGIRPDVWEAFRQRFGVEAINEIYGATDGFSTCWNENRGPFGRNAIAVRGRLWKWLNGEREKIVRIDVDTDDVLRDTKTGFVVECDAGEAGETIFKVDKAMEGPTFSKYLGNEEAGLKRRLTDVFEKNDIWFRSGDMMRMDKEGRLFFVDRLGDTFRWHSENVSTNEVADVLGRSGQVTEANVYGVLVPHADGRAGCAAVVLADGAVLDRKALAKHVLESLPRYAVPLFLRVVKEIEYTGTNKMQKGRLKAEGIDVAKIRAGKGGDQLYWLPPGKDEYMPYEAADWESIQSGRVKL